MSKNNAPFEVICINDKPRYGSLQAPWLIEKDKKYVVARAIEPFNDGEIWYELDEQPFVAYPSLHFKRIEAKPERIKTVYVSVPETVKEQSEELIMN